MPFRDSGDGQTCMGCGREPDECYCGPIPDGPPDDDSSDDGDSLEEDGD